MTGAARLAQALGQNIMEAYAWDGAAEHLAQLRAEREATEKAASKPTAVKSVVGNSPLQGLW
jgi:hypothetical protein